MAKENEFERCQRAVTLTDTTPRTPFDDPSIDGQDLLIRRINPDQHVVPASDGNNSRISSKAFSPSSGKFGGMSVDQLRLIQEADISVEDYVLTPVYTAAVQFLAKSARGTGLMIGATPTSENPFHADVWGDENRPNRFTNSQKKALQKASSWLVEISGVSVC